MRYLILPSVPKFSYSYFRLYSPACVRGPGLLSGSCYGLVAQTKRWSDAEIDCQMLGGHLVKIESSAENDFIKATFLPPQTTCWIGLTDGETEGVMRWSDGSSLSGYTNWLGGGPDNWGGNEDCVSIAMGVFWGHVTFDNAQWNDQHCAAPYWYICEKAA